MSETVGADVIQEQTEPIAANVSVSILIGPLYLLKCSHGPMWNGCPQKRYFRWALAIMTDLSQS